jgi:hypothetical protein
LFAVIGFPHTEYVAIRATRRIANHDQSSSQQPEADDALLAVAPAVALDLERRTGEHQRRVREIESTLRERCFPLARIEGH